jgi:hypothetical protein
LRKILAVEFQSVHAGRVNPENKTVAFGIRLAGIIGDAAARPDFAQKHPIPSSERNLNYLPYCNAGNTGKRYWIIRPRRDSFFLNGLRRIIGGRWFLGYFRRRG